MQVAPVALPPSRRVLPYALVGIAATCAAAVAAAALASPSPAPRARVIDHRGAPTPVAYAIEAPPTCPQDPIVGIWRAHEYRPDHQDWIEHQIHIVKQNDAYAMEHIARVRDGNERGPQKLDCARDAVEFNTVGRASLAGDQLHVWGETLLNTFPRCDGATLSYDLDSFTGTVAGDTFDSVNNDGATAKDRPYRFRRIACE